MKKLAFFILLAFVLSIGMVFAYNPDLQRLIVQIETLARDYNNLANQITRNPNGNYDRAIASLESRLMNIQSLHNSFQLSLARTPPPPLPSDQQINRLNRQMDSIQQSYFRIVNALR